MMETKWWVAAGSRRMCGSDIAKHYFSFQSLLLKETVLFFGYGPKTHLSLRQYVIRTMDVLSSEMLLQE